MFLYTKFQLLFYGLITQSCVCVLQLSTVNHYFYHCDLVSSLNFVISLLATGLGYFHQE